MESCDRCGLSAIGVGAFRAAGQVTVTKPAGATVVLCVEHEEPLALLVGQTLRPINAPKGEPSRGLHSRELGCNSASAGGRRVCPR